MPSPNQRSLSENRSLNRSCLDTRSLASDEILSLFRKADELRQLGKRFGNFFDPEERGRASKIVALLFFEPSTRTRLSFQTAILRLGHQAIAMDTGASSLTKGETLEDTVLNVEAMEPDALVIRYGSSPGLDSLLPNLRTPVLNAGSGTTAHPTQALLDAFTLYREFGSLAGKKVLVVGDVKHSRVAFSNFDVLTKLGAEIGVCGPRSLLPTDAAEWKLRRFESLDEATSWCDVYMGLRIQLERHRAADLELKSLDDYHERFGLTRTRLQRLQKNVIIMHPGPINYGVEFAAEVVRDPRSRVLEQVTNGVLIRAALLSNTLTRVN